MLYKPVFIVVSGPSEIASQRVVDQLHQEIPDVFDTEYNVKAVENTLLESRMNSFQGKTVLYSAPPSHVGYSTSASHYREHMFTVYVDENPFEIVKARLEQFRAEPFIKSNEMTQVIFSELKDSDTLKETYRGRWNFLYDTEKQDGTVLRYAISRIAQGKMSEHKAKHMSPVTLLAETEQ